MTVQKQQDAFAKEGGRGRGGEPGGGGGLAVAAAAEHCVLSGRMRKSSLQSHFTEASLNRCLSFPSNIRPERLRWKPGNKFNFSSDCSPTVLSTLVFGCVLLKVVGVASEGSKLQ